MSSSTNNITTPTGTEPDNSSAASTDGSSAANVGSQPSNDSTQSTPSSGNSTTAPAGSSSSQTPPSPTPSTSASPASSSPAQPTTEPTSSSTPSAETTTSSPDTPSPTSSPSSSPESPTSDTNTTSSTEAVGVTSSVGITSVITSTPPPVTISPTTNDFTTVLSTSTFTPTSRSVITSTIPSTTSQSSTTSHSTAIPSITPVSKDNGLSKGAVTAIAIVVPIVGVLLFGLVGLFLWRRHKARQNSKEERRKEVEDYGYNPNNDPHGAAESTAVNRHHVSGEGMQESDNGYRGWGVTSGGRKTSAPLSSSPSAGTALSPVPYAATQSDGGFTSADVNSITYPQQAELAGTNVAGPTSPPHHGPSHGVNRHSQAPLLVAPGHRPSTADSSTIGAGGLTSPVEADDGLHRGDSVASSRYTNATRNTDASEGDVQYPPANQTAHYYGHDNSQYYNENTTNYGNQHYNQYDHFNPATGHEQHPPVIQQVSARRNTRIETPTDNHFPQISHQGNSGIAQNF